MLIFYRTSACNAYRARYCFTNSVRLSVQCRYVSKRDILSQFFQQSGRGITLVFKPHCRYKIPYRGVKYTTWGNMRLGSSIKDVRTERGERVWPKRTRGWVDFTVFLRTSFMDYPIVDRKRRLSQKRYEMYQWFLTITKPLPSHTHTNGSTMGLNGGPWLEVIGRRSIRVGSNGVPAKFLR